MEINIEVHNIFFINKIYLKILKKHIRNVLKHIKIILDFQLDSQQFLTFTFINIKLVVINGNWN